MNCTTEKQALVDHFDSIAGERRKWYEKAQFFHKEDERYLQFLIPPKSSVLEIGCGNGDTLAALDPMRGVGVDISSRMITEAQRLHPEFEFHVADAEDKSQVDAIEGTFDFIVMVDTLGYATDCQQLLENLHRFCRRDTRIVIAYYSHLWEPLLNLAEKLGLRQPQPNNNVLSSADIRALAQLANLDPIKSENRLLSPVSLFGIGRLINRFVSTLPIIRLFALRHYSVCRSLRASIVLQSASVVIPARNERGNIEPLIRRLPRFCDHIEVIFIEGHSQDGTYEEMERVKNAYPNWDIKLMRQPGKGKADAVFAAFDAAFGEVLLILDADLTMPPEQLPKYWEALSSGQAEFVNGSRLIYPMDTGAMQFLNLIANRFFALMFSWLLNQRITDTLCGTKGLRKSDYIRIKENRSYFGDFDPFGDFDLIFGAAKLGLKNIDVPIRYAARTYGSTQISRFTHGLLLIKMAAFAYLKIKAL